MYGTLVRLTYLPQVSVAVLLHLQHQLTDHAVW